jgi:pyruvate dehydrogenase E2 component (dihydrolipoamide acetyltransferase)
MDYVASPATRAYAGQKGVDLDALARDTGRSRIAREDVDRYSKGETAPAQTVDQSDHPSRYWQVDHAGYGPVRAEPLSRMAQLTASNLSAANTMIPQVTHHDRADMRAVDQMRRTLAQNAAKRGVKLTALAFHVKGLARCLLEFPQFNTSLDSDGTALILKDYIHVGIAVDTDHGLLVPVIRDADRKGLWAIAAEIADLAARAQARKIKPGEMGGASITISNLGGIGGSAFTPIVNPPEVAILGLTRTEMRPVWNGETFDPVPILPLDLSYDHRVINGAAAARFLARFAALIEDPRRMVLPLTRLS